MAVMAQKRHYQHAGRSSVANNFGGGSSEGTAAQPGPVSAAAPPPFQDAARSRRVVDRQRMEVDHEYLLHVVCGKLQEVDRQHRGLITYDTFSRALAELGLRPGDRELDAVMEFCPVIDGGYVIYKDLLAEVLPGAPKAKQTTADLAIFPRDPSECSAALGAPSAQRDLSLADRAPDVRRVYARWERGLMSNAAFREQLRNLGLQPTAEFERLLTACGPSRTMPFSKLMSALQAEEVDGRRARSFCHHADEQSANDGRGGGGLAAERSGASDVGSVDGGSSAPGGHPAHAGAGPSPAIRQLICAFVDGELPSVSFRQQLQRHGVQLSPELDRLIRVHESDNHVRFGDFVRVLMRQASAWAPDAPAGAGGGDDRSAGSIAAFASGASRSGGAAASCGGGYPGEPVASNGRPPSVGRTPHPRGHYSHETPICGFSEYADGESQASRPRAPFAGSTPWSTPVDHEAKPSAPPRPRSRGGGPDSIRRHSGDIIGWSDRPPVQQRRPPESAARAPLRDDFLRWADPPVGTPSGPPSEGGSYVPPTPPVAARFGKRFYNNGPPAGERAPYGRDVDAEPGQLAPSPTPPSQKPFGTNVDYCTRPDDAGTNEYRPALAAANCRWAIR